MVLPVQNYLPHFLELLGAQSNQKTKVLVTGLNTEKEVEYLNQNKVITQFISIDGFMREKALLLWSPKVDDIQAAWINQAFNLFQPDQTQRFAATLFKTMPKNGVLGLLIEEGEGAYTEAVFDAQAESGVMSRKIYRYSENAICSLLEQTGFSVLKIGHSTKTNGTKDLMLIFSKRI